MKKISVKLWMQMLLLIGLTLGILWLFQVVMLEKYYMYRQTANIKQQGLAIAADFAEGASMDAIERDAEELNLRYNSGLEIYDATGERIYTYSSTPMMMGRGMERAIDKQGLIEEAFSEGKTVVRQVRHNRLNSNILLVGIPIMQQQVNNGILVISAPMASIQEAEAIIKEQLLIVTVILILISLVITYFFSRAFTRPILRINEAAARMAGGNLSVKLDIESEDELGMLSATINELSVQLQKIEQLRKELIANVSHEFRTPLSLIKGYAETIRDVT
ncbi:MAG: HAMP domain-containing protein, partial [Pseudomonadota bacterium]